MRRRYRMGPDRLPSLLQSAHALLAVRHVACRNGRHGVCSYTLMSAVHGLRPTVHDKGAPACDLVSFSGPYPYCGSSNRMVEIAGFLGSSEGREFLWRTR